MKQRAVYETLLGERKMTRIIRGKVIVERRNGEGELIETSLSSTKGPPVGDPTGISEEATPLNENILRDGATFATSTAPWVGAERAWRRGIVPPPHEEWQQYGRHADEEASYRAMDLSLTDAELATVLSTMPPPASAADDGKHGPRFGHTLRYTVPAVLTAVAAVAVFWALGTADKPEEASLQPSAFESASAIPTLPDLAELPSASGGVAERSSSLVPLPTAVFGQDVEVLKEEAFEPTATMIFVVRGRKPTAIRAASSTTTKTNAANAIERDGDGTVTGENLASAEPETANDQEAAFNLTNPYPKLDTEENTAAPGADAKTNDQSKPLNREAVVSAMDTVTPRVIACGNGRSGKIVMRIVVSGSSGRVTDAAAAYAPYVDTPVGDCVARAVKKAQFPRFKESEMTIKYPFEF